MKLTVFLSLLMLLQIQAAVYSQNSGFDITVENEEIRDVLKELEQKSDYRFFYSEDFQLLNKRVRLKASNASIQHVLDKLLEGSSLTYQIFSNNLVVIVPSDDIKQGTKVTGTVTDVNGNPLPGVNIVEAGTNNGAVTDLEGNYSITVSSEDAVLSFSFIGYLSEEVEIAGQTSINITLVEDIQALDEVVVVGYATQKKVNLTGAVSTVNAEEIANRPTIQTSTVLQGLVPGVVVQQNLGSPGNDDATIRIRGIGSLGQGNQNPLVLVDGMQMGLSDVNPEDIESISVLKDAASASIYGSRAANGVILITTKRAKPGAFQINADFSYGGQSATMLPEFIDVKQQMMLEDVIRINRGADIEWGRDKIEEHVNYLANNPPNDQYQDNDWYRTLVADNAPLHREYINFTGGSEKVRAGVSLTNLNQDGLIGNSSFSRQSIRSNTDILATPWLKFQTDLYVQVSEKVQPAERQDRLWQMVNELEPYRPMYVHDSKGNQFWGEAWNGNNPLAYTEDGGTDKDNNTYTLLNLNAILTPIEGMEVDLGYSRTTDNTEGKEFVAQFDYYRPGASIGDDPFLVGKNPSKNTLSLGDTKRTRNYYKSTVSYERQLSNHYTKLLVGFDATDHHFQSFGASREGFPLGEKYPQLSLGGEENQSNGSSENEWAIASFFGRLNYSFSDRYLLEGSFRYDGSSRFAEDERWGFFPSISAGWRISEESFMESQSLISNLKLRGSWGQLGNQNIGNNYPYQSVVDLDVGVVLSEAVQQGAAITNGVPSALTWEKATMANIGLDVGLLQNRFSGSVEYYIKKTDEILWRLLGSETYGLSFPFQNAAAMENKGVELTLSWQDRIGEFSYFISGQFDDNVNEVTDLAGTGKQVSNDKIIEEGKPFRALYGWEAIGFLSASDLEDENVPKQNATNIKEGSLKFKDQNGDGVIDPDDRVVIGNEFPRMNYSANFGFNFKGIDFSVLLQGVGKRDGYVRRLGQSFGDYQYTWEADFYIPEDHSIFVDHGYDQLGLEPNTNPAYPAPETDNGDLSSHWIKSRSYLRVKNLTLGYSLPSNIVQKVKFKKIRFYVSADNLITWSNFIDGFDPELTSGRGFYEYPNISKYLAGINLSF